MQPDTRDDREIVLLALEGRERGFKELVRRYERPIFSLVFRMVRDRELAEDLAQEAFVKVFRALDQYDPAHRFSSWLFKVAHNVAVDHLRRKQLDTVSIDGSPHGDPADGSRDSGISLPSTLESPEEFTENRELGDRIEQAIGRLRPDYRAAVLLRHVEGYSYEEVAEIMEVPLGTVKTYIHRARGELRTILAGVPT